MLSLIQPNLFVHLAPFVVATFFTTSLCAAINVEKVALKHGSEKIDTIGRLACSKSESVEIELTNNLKTKNEFRALIKAIKKESDTGKAKGEDLCESKIAAGRTAENFTKSSPTISMRKLLPDSACQSEGLSENYALCVYEGSSVGDDLVAFAIYRIETAVGKLENIGDRTAVNGEVVFGVKVGGKSSSNLKIETCFGKTSECNVDSDPKNCPGTCYTHETQKREVRITNLENNVEWNFKVRLNDPKDGPSDWSTSFKETPVPVAYPLGNYNGAGGQMEFNCQQGNGNGTLLLFAVTLAMLLLVRMRGRHIRSSVLSACFAMTMVALASKNTHAGFGQVNIGLLGAMYRPDLDNEKLASGEKVLPFYKCFFRKKTSDKNGPINPLMGAEVDLHLWDGFGSLQLGLGLGYTFVNGHAVKLSSDGTPNCDDPVTSASSTLHMYQVRPQLTYAFDFFAEYFPLIPYARGALIGHGYIFRDGSKSASSASVGDRVVKPNGFRFGYQAAVGLMLMLDFLEPSALKSARGQGFLDHVYLKGELSYTKIDTFGRRGFQFSAKDVMGTSLPLMWTFGLVFAIP